MTEPEDKRPTWLVRAAAHSECINALEAMGETQAARRLVRHLAGTSTDLSVAVVVPFEELLGEKPTGKASPWDSSVEGYAQGCWVQATECICEVGTKGCVRPHLRRR
jgi:hypothetical protein